MSSNTTQIVTGSFVSTGNPINIVVPSSVNWFQLIDSTNAAAQTNGLFVKAFWSSDMPAGAAYFEINTAGTKALIGNYLTTNGVTPFSFGGPEVAGTTFTGTAIINANPAVASSATTVPVGSVVRILNPLSMEQISGENFSVTASSAGASFTLGYLDASGFADPATTFSFTILNPTQAWQPQWRTITKITKASSAVITFGQAHNYVVGQLLRIKVPSAYGMSQINGLVGQVTAISTTNNTVTVNINSTGFSTFAYPTSANAPSDQWAMAVPIGEFPNTTSAVPFDNGGTMGLTLGSNICGALNDQMYWIAYSGVPIS